jgi:cell division protein FtsI/penicillin-binding protein 2
MVAALAAGGRYVKCPPTMELAAKCTETSLVADPASLRPILAGMRAVMARGGTGGHLSPPADVRVYGKTGTADVRGFTGEEPFGVAPAQPAPPHSWFVAIAEPADGPECALEAPGRLVVAVVVPRGGTGAATAGPAAMEVLAAARRLGYLAGRGQPGAATAGDGRGARAP